METTRTLNARYGRTAFRVITALNFVLFTVIVGGLWFFAVRANHHGIPPNTNLGFRSEHTLASLHGWYVAQRVGFHIAAVAASASTAVVSALVAVAYVRRLNLIWIVTLFVIGQIAVAVCLMIAGHYADQAAIAVEMKRA